MADEIRQFTATIPAGTVQALPFTKKMPMPWRIVDRLEITVPPGGSGLVGFYIAVAGVRIIPYDSDPYIVTADERMIWDLYNYPDSGDWSLGGYNTGTIDHSVFVRFLVRVPQLHSAVQIPIFDAAELELGDGVDLTNG